MQYPPVARVGTPFSFQFAPTNFSSASEGLRYSLIGNPPWLSLDDNSRTLSGTPRAKDVGTVNFTITAAEQAGAVANMESQLLVIQGDAPTTKEDISAPLSAAGEMSEPDTVILKPLKPFSISFPRTLSMRVVWHCHTLCFFQTVRRYLRGSASIPRRELLLAPRHHRIMRNRFG
jgi:hypothetical protein